MPTSEEINVQINYKEDTGFGEYSDALYLPYAEYNAMTTKQKEDWKATKKKERIDNYKAYRQYIKDNPPPPAEEEV